jgi:hypothetical protein
MWGFLIGLYLAMILYPLFQEWRQRRHDRKSQERRTFECRTCHRIEKISIAIDPLKTDAVGWLAGELRPPR